METFTQHSYDPYDRHRYKLVYTSGKVVFFEHYEDVQSAWWNHPSEFLSHVEVIDRDNKKQNKKKGGGFK